MPVAQFEIEACSHVVFCVSVCFYILFIQLEAFSDSCAEMSSSKLEIGSCEVKKQPYTTTGVTHLTTHRTGELPAAIKHHIE